MIPCQLLTHDAWLSEQARSACFRLSTEGSNGRLPGAEVLKALTEISGEAHFVFAKVPCGDIETAKTLSQAGFYVVDTNVQFRKRRESPDCSQIQNCRPAISADAEGVKAVAARSFVFSRFHLDPAFGKSAADCIKAAWAGDYFLGKRGDRMVVAEVDGEIAGFNLLIDREDESTIDLIAVAPEYRRRGLACAMCLLAEANSPNTRDMVAGTQVANTPSVRFYENLGYRYAGAAYVFHYHGK